MAKLAQLLNIEPANELKFQGPFRTAVASYMRLTNPTDHDICFKIKTTAPKKYCVRPNCGVLEPKESQEIAIVLQPFIFDANEKNKHKFMVQSMVKPDDEDTNLEVLWKKYPEKLMDSKLRCVFEIPMDNNQPVQAGKEAPNSQNATAALETSDPPMAGDFMSQKTTVINTTMMNTEDDHEEDSEILKELEKIREDECTLRQENLELKEQVLRLRMQVDGRAKEQRAPFTSMGVGPAATTAGRLATPSVLYPDQYTPLPQLSNRRNDRMLEIIVIVIASFACVIGILIGKFAYSDGKK